VGDKGGGGGRGGEMTQALYAHMNNKTVKKKINKAYNNIIPNKTINTKYYKANNFLNSSFAITTAKHNYSFK
jgi:hypothetical protein